MFLTYYCQMYIYYYVHWTKIKILVIQVWELPPKVEVLAWSDKTGIEMFKHGDHMMGIQGHPEYTKDILLHLIDRLLQRNYIMVNQSLVSCRVLNRTRSKGFAWLSKLVPLWLVKVDRSVGVILIRHIH